MNAARAFLQAATGSAAEPRVITLTHGEWLRRGFVAYWEARQGTPPRVAEAEYAARFGEPPACLYLVNGGLRVPR